MTEKKALASLLMVGFLWGCDSFRIGRQFQSGRQAFLSKNYELLSLPSRSAGLALDRRFECIIPAREGGNHRGETAG